MDKAVATAADAVADIGDGASLAVGGFGLSGVPNVLIAALHEQGARGLGVVSNNCGVDGGGLGILLAAGRIARVTGSYVGENKAPSPSGCAPAAPESPRSSPRPASAPRSPTAACPGATPRTAAC
jgi:acyl CoA:acetate/3-ketoacid CoA transferase alpha subunit